MKNLFSINRFFSWTVVVVGLVSNLLKDYYLSYFLKEDQKLVSFIFKFEKKESQPYYFSSQDFMQKQFFLVLGLGCVVIWLWSFLNQQSR